MQMGCWHIEFSGEYGGFINPVKFLGKLPIFVAINVENLYQDLVLRVPWGIYSGFTKAVTRNALMSYTMKKQPKKRMDDSESSSMGS